MHENNDNSQKDSDAEILRSEWEKKEFPRQYQDPETFDEEVNERMEHFGKIQKIHEEKYKIFEKRYLNEDGSINWRNIYCGERSEETTNKYVTLGASKEDEISFRLYNILNEDQVSEIESQVKTWLDRNDMQDSATFTFKITDEEGSLLSLEKHGLRAFSHFVLPYVTFSRYKIMVPVVSNEFDSYWIASSPRWPRVISSERLYQMQDGDINVDWSDRHNCLERLFGRDSENHFKKIEEIIGSEIK